MENVLYLPQDGYLSGRRLVSYVALSAVGYGTVAFRFASVTRREVVEDGIDMAIRGGTPN